MKNNTYCCIYFEFTCQCTWVLLCIKKANKSLDINLIVEGVFYLTVLKNCWSILNLKNTKDLFTGRKPELSLNLFKQAIKTASALSCGKTIMHWAPPPYRRVKTPSVHHQTVSTDYTFSHPQVSLTYLELVITGSEFTVNLCPPGPCYALQKKECN